MKNIPNGFPKGHVKFFMLMVPVLSPNTIPFIVMFRVTDDPVKPWLVPQAFINDLLRES